MIQKSHPEKSNKTNKAITQISSKLFSDPTITYICSTKVDKISTKDQPNQNASKKIIKQWFFQLESYQKQQYSSISDQDFLYFILYFIQKAKLLTHKFSNNYKNFQKQFMHKKYKCQANFTSIPKEKIQAEKFLLDNLRIRYSGNYKLFFPKELFNHSKALFDYLEILSQGQIFQYSEKQLKKNDIYDNPLWFSKFGYNTLGEWIASAVEKSILRNYNNIKKGIKDFEITLKYGQKLMNFFDKIQRNEKKQLILTQDFILLQKHNIRFQQILELKLNQVTLESLELLTKCIATVQQLYSQAINIDMAKPSRGGKSKKKNKQKIILVENEGQRQSKIERKQQVSEPIKQIVEFNDQFPKKEIKSQIIKQKQQHAQFQIKIIQKIQTISEIKSIRDQIPEDWLQNFHNQEKLSQASLINDENTEQTTDQTFITDNIEYQVNVQLTNCDKSENLQLSSFPQENYKKNYRRKRKNRRKKNSQNNQQIRLNNLFHLLINKKVIDYANKISANSKKLVNTRMIVFQRVKYFTTRIYEDYYNIDAKVFGSNSLGLALPSSDIDILLTGFNIQSKQDSINILENLSEYLKKMKWVISCNTYSLAKIPIIKLQIDPHINFLEMFDFPERIKFFNNQTPNLQINDRSHNLIKVDLTLEARLGDSTHIGFESTQFMKKCMMNHPELGQIVLILKKILFSRGFNQAYRGGISSYSLFLMIASYLKQFQSNKNMQENKDPKKIGVLLYQILEFYCLEFDNQTLGISYFQDKSCYFKISSKYQSLHIVQPIFGNLITSNCTKFQQIKQEFKSLYNSFNEIKQEIRLDLAQLSQEEAKPLIQKKKNPQKWIKRYQKNPKMQISNFIV